ncbi:MAG: amino acid permease [Candidatus Binatia bacterium]
MELKSVLGRKEVLALAFGAIIGWGWVVLSGALIDQAGTLGSVLAFLVGALMVGFVGLTYAELTSALPRAGGELTFTYRALGPGWSWICGWSLLLAYVGVCAFEAVAIATVVNYLFPHFKLGYLYSVAGSEVYWSWILVGVGSGAFVGVVNWLGIKTSALVGAGIAEEVDGRIVLPQARAYGWHILRHSMGSNLTARTGNLKLTQMQLGHADITTTGNIYTHNQRPLVDTAVDAPDAEMFDGRKRVFDQCSIRPALGPAEVVKEASGQ